MSEYTARGVRLLALPRKGRAAALAAHLHVPAYFVLANAAAAHATLNLVRGQHIDRWSTIRGDGPMQ